MQFQTLGLVGIAIEHRIHPLSVVHHVTSVSTSANRIELPSAGISSLNISEQFVVLVAPVLVALNGATNGLELRDLGLKLRILRLDLRELLLDIVEFLALLLGFAELDHSIL